MQEVLELANVEAGADADDVERNVAARDEAPRGVGRRDRGEASEGDLGKVDTYRGHGEPVKRGERGIRGGRRRSEDREERVIRLERLSSRRAACEEVQERCGGVAVDEHRHLVRPRGDGVRDPAVVGVSAVDDPVDRRLSERANGLAVDSRPDGFDEIMPDLKNALSLFFCGEK